MRASARMLVLQWLLIQDHHVRALRAAAEQHGFASDTIPQTLTDLHRQGLVCNTGYGRWAIAEPGLRLLLAQRQRRRLETMRADVRDLQRVVALLERIEERNAHG